jgi:phage tail sheath gpL-like
MSAVAIVAGATEGIQLLSNLFAAGSQVSAAIQKAQASNTPLDLTTILSAEAQAEVAELAAIAAAQAAGK